MATENVNVNGVSLSPQLVEYLEMWHSEAPEFGHDGNTTHRICRAVYDALPVEADA